MRGWRVCCHEGLEVEKIVGMRKKIIAFNQGRTPFVELKIFSSLASNLLVLAFSKNKEGTLDPKLDMWLQFQLFMEICPYCGNLFAGSKYESTFLAYECTWDGCKL
jgi:hypothetical protein